jgi:hypothetical protein
MSEFIITQLVCNKYRDNGKTYGQSKTRRTPVHALHVHVRTEQSDLAIFIPVSLQALE